MLPTFLRLVVEVDLKDKNKTFPVFSTIFLFKRIFSSNVLIFFFRQCCCFLLYLRLDCAVIVYFFCFVLCVVYVLIVFDSFVC